MTSSPVKSLLATCLNLYQPCRRHAARMLATPHRKYSRAPPSPEVPLVKKLIYTNKVYLPVGPYSQGVRAGRMLYVSGVLGADEMGTLDPAGVRAQTRRALCNLSRVLAAGGASMRSVVKTTVLLADMSDFRAVNETYMEYFEMDHPARATYQVARLQGCACLEIDAVAVVGPIIVEQMNAPL